MLAGIRACSSLLAFAIATGAAPPATPGQSGSGVEVSYALAEPDLTVAEPVLLKCVVTNWLTESIVVDDRVNHNGYGGFRVTVTRPDGKTYDAPKPSPHELLLKPVSVGPRMSHTSVLLLNKWVDFDIPGRYSLRLEAKQPFTTASGTEVPYPTEGRIDIDIRPRDPARLEKICSELWRKMTDAPSVAQSTEEAETLSYIRDPIAVPYLARGLAAGTVLSHWMIDALTKIADSPAVDALVANLSSTDEDTRTLVRGALKTIEMRTGDATIKQKIKRSGQK